MSALINNFTTVQEAGRGPQMLELRPRQCFCESIRYLLLGTDPDCFSRALLDFLANEAVKHSNVLCSAVWVSPFRNIESRHTVLEEPIGCIGPL